MMAFRSPLYRTHVELHAKMVDFAGWDMPLHYGSQIEEHHSVRSNAGMFDVSHMTIVDLEGDGVREFLRFVLANDVARIREPGGALYACMLNEQGGVIDDLIVYALDEQRFRMVMNAAARDRDLAWLRARAERYPVRLRERVDVAMIAIQGPQARAKACAVLAPALAERARDLPRFRAGEAGGWLVARTGYTGEDGFEVILPTADARSFWTALSGAGVRPCGLGARDSLRLEAGMNLYGADMDETVTPLECGLRWTLAWEPRERDFIGRSVLEVLRDHPDLRRFVGLVLRGRGVMRPHHKVRIPGVGEGEVTSGGFSPTLGRSIGLARVPAGTASECSVEIRGRQLPATIVKPPFVREGRSCIDL
jgi:aminomethyltransferase